MNLPLFRATIPHITSPNATPCRIYPIYTTMILLPMHHTFAFFIITLAALLFVQTNTIIRLIGFILFVTVPFFGLFHGIVAALVLLIVSQWKKSIDSWFYTIFGIMTLACTVLYLPLYLKYGLIEFIPPTDIGILRQYFADMGSMNGFSVFSVMLALIGFPICWQHKRKAWAAFLAFFIVLLMSLWLPYMTLYLGIAVAIFSAIALLRLIERRWMLKQIQNITLLLIMCGILFSFISYIDENKDRIHFFYVMELTMVLIPEHSQDNKTLGVMQEIRP